MAPQDILREIPLQDLPKLAEIYHEHRHWAPNVLSLIRLIPRWKNSDKYPDRIKIYSPNDSWREDGTIIVTLKANRRDLFIFTLDDKCENLYKGLTQTRLIDLTRIDLGFSVHERHIPTLKRALAFLGIDIVNEVPCIIYSISPSKALATLTQSDEGDDYYIADLQPHNSMQVVAPWPHTYEGAAQDLGEHIEINGACGVFLRDSHELVAWGVVLSLGHLGLVQTEKGYQRRGFGAAVTKFMTRRLARDGVYVSATVTKTNTASLTMFDKLGFDQVGTCSFIFMSS